jgi:hypothetical protein
LSVDELVLGPPRVDRAALDVHADLGAGKCLHLHFAGRRAVDGVGGDRTERVDREVDDATTDLLVGVERHLDRSVRDVGIRLQVGDRGHDLGDARLVVGA